MKKVCVFMACMTVCGATLSAQTYFKAGKGGDGVTITGCIGYGNIVIPATFEGYTVVGIGGGAFKGNKRPISVTIPDSVIRIGTGAFGGGSVTSITVSATNQRYKEIEGVLFTKDGKTLLAYPSGGKTAYTIPTGVTSIGAGAFADCPNLISVTIPTSVTTIGDHAFIGCASLTSVTIPGSVTSIGYATFGSCSSLTSVTISMGVTTIGKGAFDLCTNLVSVAIPNSVTTIDIGAFYLCDKLKPEIRADIERRFGKVVFER